MATLALCAIRPARRSTRRWRSGFPGPRSETGEDIAELQLHGGRAVIAAVLAALGGIEGLRLASRASSPAAPSRTASSTSPRSKASPTDRRRDEAQRRQAFRQMQGLLGDRAETGARG